MLALPKTISVKGRDGKVHDGVRMWHYMALQEGTLGVDPDYQKTNDGRMPPVIHVDTDAPLYSDRDGHLITDKLWGLYYKPDFHFGGVQGGAMPAVVKPDPDDVRVDPYGPKSPEFVVTDNFADMWTSALAFCQKRFEGQHAKYRSETVGRHRLLHARQLSRVRPLSRQRLRDRRFEPRLQDDRRRRARRRRAARRRARAARAVPLLALRRRPAAPGQQQPVSVELRGAKAFFSWRSPVRRKNSHPFFCAGSTVSLSERPPCLSAAGAPWPEGERLDSSRNVAAENETLPRSLVPPSPPRPPVSRLAPDRSMRALRDVRGLQASESS